MDDNTKPPQGDPADIFNDLAASRKASKLTVKRQIVLVNVPVGRPANNVYFRTHKDIKLEDATVIRDEEGGRKAFYFIVPVHARSSQTRTALAVRDYQIGVHVA